MSQRPSTVHVVGGKIYEESSREKLQHDGAMVDVERGALGYDHALLGGQILSIWKFPSLIPKVVALHHEPALAYQNEDMGFVVAMWRICSQIDRQLTYNDVNRDAFFEKLATGVDCEYAAVSEESLIGKRDALDAAEKQALSVFS